jgi:hypothetical protein
MHQKIRGMVQKGGMYVVKSRDGSRMYRIPVAK